MVWHTQGSGKSFSMLFFAARVVRHPAMQNPALLQWAYSYFTYKRGARIITGRKEIEAEPPRSHRMETKNQPNQQEQPRHG